MVSFILYGMSILLGIFGLAVIIGGAMVGGGDWIENLTESATISIDNESPMDVFYSSIRIAAFIAGAYFIGSALFGCIANKCEACPITFCYGIVLSAGFIATFIASLIFLGFAGLNDDIITDICNDNYENLPYGLGAELDKLEFSIRDVDEIL